jgi:hypothetical protein
MQQQFIDYKKAYDSVPHSWLIKILKIYKINIKLNHLLYMDDIKLNNN